LLSSREGGSVFSGRYPETPAAQPHVGRAGKACEGTAVVRFLTDSNVAAEGDTLEGKKPKEVIRLVVLG
jgi:hypothetical protein